MLLPCQASSLREEAEDQNKLLSKLYKENDILVFEKLEVDNMLQNHSLAKSILDASFGRFIRKVIYKAEMLGKHFIVVDPWVHLNSAITA